MHGMLVCADVAVSVGMVNLNVCMVKCGRLHVYFSKMYFCTTISIIILSQIVNPSK